MSESKIIKSEFKLLDNFVKSISTKMVVKVGIFGTKAQRKTKDNKIATNAQIGFLNEFGTNRIPARSFLRMPLFQYSEDILGMVNKAGALNKLAMGKDIQVLADLGMACERVIVRAFASSGWGDWAPNAPSTIRRKKSDTPLIDTGQLQRSISSAVVNP